MVNQYLRLFLISFTILFLELLLIRFISTEIRIFAYLSNLVLLTVFVGIGLGMIIKKRIPLHVSSILLAILTGILVTGVFSSITQLVSPLSESFIWFQSNLNELGSSIYGIFLTTVMLVIILFIFIPLGSALGEIFIKSTRPILVYSLDIVASLIGMWLFYTLSNLNSSPLIGIVLVEVLLILLASRRLYAILCSVFVFILLLISFNPQSIVGGVGTYWSPYQKLLLTPLSQEELRAAGYMLKVNNVGYMGLLDLSKDYQSNIKNKLKDKTLPEGFSFDLSNQYDLPYTLKAKPADVLIIGAGGGNDVAAAVRAGAGSIDAVEIDPLIVRIGKQYHPEKPYLSSRVNIITNDGRSYIKNTNKKYDLVVMGLADSHTLNSSLTNLQLDNYLYTWESFSEIKNILKEDGILFLSFDVRKSWIGGHLQASISKAFGQNPLIFSMQDNSVYGWGGMIYVADNQKGNLDKLLSTNKNLSEFIKQRKLEFTDNSQPLTDNWPYLYLEKPRIPILHIIISACFVGVLMLFVPFFPKARLVFDMFFLGTGFLLYEFQNISRTALLFGNTWVTSLLTITSVLALILLANLIYSRWKINIRLLYILLFVSFLIQLPIPLTASNILPVLIKSTFGLLFLNIPFFFSALIFISLFSNAENKSAAFASNLIGSALGGLLGLLSYLYGIQFLIVLSIVLYFFSYLSHIQILKYHKLH